MNETTLRDTIKSIFTFGMWHDVPSGYERVVDRLENAILERDNKLIQFLQKEEVAGNPEDGFEIEMGKVTLGMIDKISRDNYDAGFNDGTKLAIDLLIERGI